MADEQRKTADERRRKVAELMAAGLSAREIAKRLDGQSYPNCSVTTIQRDRKANEKLWRDTVVADIQKVKDRHSQHLDEAIERSILAGIGFADAADAAAFYAANTFPLMRERAKLLGLYAPTRVDVYDYVRRWSREHGFDEARAVELAQEVIDQEGF